MKYVIQMNYVDSKEIGYYGSVTWNASPLEKAKIFDTKKEARAVASRMADRFHFEGVEVIEYKLAPKKKFVVHMIESEAGWGRKIDEIKKFDTEQQAKNFVKKYNDKYNNKPVAPEWYIKAEYIGEEK
jgi:hypothetical protein